jgi:peptide/nickel transport system substrate-binding protein
MGCRRRRTEEDQLGCAARFRGLKRRVCQFGESGVFFFLIALITLACSSPPPAPATGETDELIVGFPEGNVAAADLGPGQFANMLSLDGLTASNVDGRSLPRLAESWQWEKDGRLLRVKLRPGVSFHDGTPLTAAAVARILRTAIASPASHPSEAPSASYSSLSDIVALSDDGDLQLLVELSRPSAFLPEDLSMPLALKRNVGTGPYRVVKREQSEMVFERFDRYYQGLPAIARIEVRTFDEMRTAWSSLLRGDLDMVTNVPADAVEFIRTDDVDVISYERWFQFMVGFNSQQAPFKSAAVRKALNVAIDREALIERALKGHASPSTGPLWPKHWAYDSSIASYSFDQRLAMTLLDGAGYRAGSGRSRSGVPQSRFWFTCLLPSEFSILERIGLELQKQLYDVGVDMQFEVVPLEEYNDRIRDGQFQAVLVDMISGPSFGRNYIFWRSAKQFKGLNVFGYENTEAERLFGLLRSSPMNEAATRSATRRLQQVFLEDPPALFLAWNERTRAVRREFRVVNERDRDPLLTLWRWAADNKVAIAQ